jgi:hypothetical protein
MDRHGGSDQESGYDGDEPNGISSDIVGGSSANERSPLEDDKDNTMGVDETYNQNGGSDDDELSFIQEELSHIESLEELLMELEEFDDDLLRSSAEADKRT